MNKIELLSPAGNKEALIAAVAAGADAIYLGGKSFGARAFSNNFTSEEIVEAISYCHLFGVKVYVTCNTLVYDSEVPEFLNYVKFLHQNNVDAILIQDLGMLDLVRKTFPKLEIHASTQMHIHNLDGVKLMKSLGLKRVVLARETSIDKIKEIKEKTDIDLEVFIHGSLCISYSGQCLMSSLIGGRSANRGACAGSCRLPYDVLEYNKIVNKEDHYPLSTKDLCAIENIGSLIDLGITSLKIEGRMKSKEYVYCVTKLYRQAIDSYQKTGVVSINEDVLHDLKKTFNREYTKGFLFNTKNNDLVNPKRPNNQGIKIGKVIDYSKHFATIKITDDLNIGDGLRILGESDVGVKVNEFFINRNLVKQAKKGDVISIETKAKVEIDSDVLLTSSEFTNKKINDLIKNNPRKVSIDGELTVKINEPLVLTINDGINYITVSSNTIEKSISMPTTKETIIEKLNKLGDTPYKFNNLEIDMDNNIFLPLKILNDLRREAIDLLNSKRQYKTLYEVGSYTINVPSFNSTRKKTCLIETKLAYDNLDTSVYDTIYCEEKVSNTTLKLPRVINNYEPNEDKVLVGEIGALNKLKNIDTDFSLNVTNSYTVAFLHSLGVDKITLSYELTDEQIKKLVSTYEERYHQHPNLEVIVYGKEEMMISKFNLNDYYSATNLFLKDRLNKTYEVKIKNNMSIIYNSKPRNNTNIDYYKMGINSIRYNFVD